MMDEQDALPLVLPMPAPRAAKRNPDLVVSTFMTVARDLLPREQFRDLMDATHEAIATAEVEARYARR